MWEIPCRMAVTSGIGTGKTALNAFDKALLDAGIGNLNLIRVSSVLPAGTEIVNLKRTEPLNIVPGTFIPTVYSSITDNNINQKIASAIAIGIPSDNSKNGMIFENSVRDTLDKAYESVEQMIKESFEARNIEIGEILVEGSEFIVKHEFGCTVSAVIMLL